MAIKPDMAFCFFSSPLPPDPPRCSSPEHVHVALYNHPVAPAPAPFARSFVMKREREREEEEEEEEEEECAACEARAKRACVKSNLMKPLQRLEAPECGGIWGGVQIRILEVRPLEVRSMEVRSYT